MVVKSKSVLVTGGTGTIGKKVVEKLIEKKYEVYVLSRKKLKKNNKITYLMGDINSDIKLKSCDYIIHLAACLDSRDKENCYLTNIKGTKNILNFAKKLKIKKLIYVSTIMVFKDSLNKIRNENWKKEKKSDNFYIDSKIKAELIVKECSIPSVIVYPTAVLDLKNRAKPYGSDIARFLWKIAGGFNGCISCLFGSGQRILNYVLVDDIADGIILALEKGKTGQNYILGGENIEVSRYLKKMARFYKTHTLPIRIPSFFSKNRNMNFSSQKAINELDYNPKTI
jgi:nucleoside-diphosphate-sugar epimerase